jgi:cell division protease FtsH
MSDSDNQRNSSGGRQGPPDRFQPKVLLIWLVIFAAIIGIWSVTESQQTNVQQLRIVDVVRQVEAGNVERGIIKPDPNAGPEFYQIDGFLKAPISGSAVEAETTEITGASGLGGGAIKFQASGRVMEDDYVMLREKLEERPASTMLMNVLISLLPFIIIIAILYFLFLRQIRQAGKGAMSFGKSKAKMLTRDREKITFKDVAGCDEAKEEVSEVVDFLKDPKKFQKIGGRIPKGVLMVGPPGTGKTLLARAVAGEADVPFFSISGSDFVEMFVGVGAARVRDMFEQGRKNAPCLIFIDEIDAVGRQRGAGLGGGNDEREQTLNSLLVEMDGFDAHEGVIIIAATNRPDVLDSALLRPGRFDRQVVIDLPDLEGREAILRVHAKKIALSKNIDLKSVARGTPGFSGADLANLLNEGALIAARKNRKEVSNRELDEARDKISYGRERKRLMDDEDKKITAWHEAGHAIIQAILDDDYMPVHKVTIIPRGQSLGSTMMMPKKDILNESRRRVITRLCTLMGGRAAEEIAFQDITSGASGDIKMATKLARRMVCDWGMSPLGPIAYGENQDHIFLGKEISRDQNYSEQTAQRIDQEIHDLVEGQHQRAVEILTENRKAMDILAEALLEYETLGGVHVKEIIDHGELRSPINLGDAKEEEKSVPQPAEKPEPKKKDEGLEPGGEPAGAPA